MAATHGKEYYSVLKFYSLSPHAVHHILSDLDYAGACGGEGGRASLSNADGGGIHDDSEGAERESGMVDGHRCRPQDISGPELPFIPDEDEDRLISAVRALCCSPLSNLGSTWRQGEGALGVVRGTPGCMRMRACPLA